VKRNLPQTPKNFRAQTLWMRGRKLSREPFQKRTIVEASRADCGRHAPPNYPAPIARGTERGKASEIP
ncbi:MAG TPA: hypothetical protein VN788_05160, partial [Verrucomicrobiae bacterium]|nr:hypothetical protein [Verrucomicrobiae bacterium]